MSKRLKTPDESGSTDYEFVPPIDLPETWGVPWERQLGAVQAWQQAGGEAQNAPGATGAAGDHSPRRAQIDSAPPPTMRTIAQLNTRLVSLREQLLQLQLEASNIAITELTESRGAATTFSRALEEAGPLQPDSATRLAALARTVSIALAEAQADMTAIAGFAPDRVPAERRRRATVIHFPDRRSAA